MDINDDKYKEIWNQALAIIENNIKDSAFFDTIFYSSYIHSIVNDTVYIVVSNKFCATTITNTYIDLVTEVIYNITQSNFKVIITTKNAIEEENNNKKTLFEEINKPYVSNLNPKYTFDNFVVSDNSNREVYTASMVIAKNPGVAYNPLFIYGKSGLGKTHLLHAIGNDIRLNKPNLKVLYLTADDFFEEYVKAIKESNIENLKDKYRDIDVLLIDDIQFLTKKEKTKEVFFHIFNLFVNNNKQIVITSDRHPSELKSLEDRLVSRFSSGLSIEVKTIDYETALRILHKKIESQNINDKNISEEVLEYIAKHNSGDVRQLEGALNKLLFHIIVSNPSGTITLKDLHETFNIEKQENFETLDADKIKNIVAEYYNISVSQLVSKLRTSSIVVARHIAMYLCRELLNMPLIKIGEEFGGKDHTTVINACEKVNKMLKTDNNYKTAVEELKKMLKN